MLKKYSPEQFWELYEKLPQELKDALWAEKTGNNIVDVCQRYEIEESAGDVIDLVGQVLVGVLPPEDFQDALEKELNIEKEIAKKASQEINRFIFYPVRTELEKLYQMKVTTASEEPSSTKATEGKEEPASAEASAGKEEKPTGPKKDDTYREPVE